MKESMAETQQAPVTVRWAAIALAGYGLVVLVNATVLQALNDWEGIAEYPRALVRTVAVGGVAWGLLRRARWAWWLGLALTLVWIGTSVFGIAILVVYGNDAQAFLPSGFYATFTLTVALLLIALTLMLLPRSRAAFRKQGHVAGVE
jgi:hypothetical protein